MQKNVVKSYEPLYWHLFWLQWTKTHLFPKTLTYHSHVLHVNAFPWLSHKCTWFTWDSKWDNITTQLPWALTYSIQQFTPNNKRPSLILQFNVHKGSDVYLISYIWSSTRQADQEKRAMLLKDKNTDISRLFSHMII